MEFTTDGVKMCSVSVCVNMWKCVRVGNCMCISMRLTSVFTGQCMV